MFFRLEHPLHGFKMLHIDEILAITTKSRRTVQHWIQKPGSIDGDSLKLLELYAFGIFPTHSSDFDGLYIENNEIRSRHQKRFFLTAQELGSVFLMYQLNRALKDELKDLRAHQAHQEPRPGAQVFNLADYRKEKESAPIGRA